MEMRACVSAIKRGDTISKKKKPIRRLLHKRIVTHSLKENTSSGYEIRAVPNMLRLSVGRSGEVSTANWEFAKWCQEEEVLMMVWPETKTGTEATLSYGPDIDWEMDVIYSIASYLVTSEGGAGIDEEEEDVNWLFPAFSKLTGSNAAAKVNNYLKTCTGKVRPILYSLIALLIVIFLLQLG